MTRISKCYAKNGLFLWTFMNGLFPVALYLKNFPKNFVKLFEQNAKSLPKAVLNEICP